MYGVEIATELAASVRNLQDLAIEQRVPVSASVGRISA